MTTRLEYGRPSLQNNESYWTDSCRCCSAQFFFLWPKRGTKWFCSEVIAASTSVYGLEQATNDRSDCTDTCIDTLWKTECVPGGGSFAFCPGLGRKIALSRYLQGLGSAVCKQTSSPLHAASEAQDGLASADQWSPTSSKPPALYTHLLQQDGPTNAAQRPLISSQPSVNNEQTLFSNPASRVATNGRLPPANSQHTIPTVVVNQADPAPSEWLRLQTYDSVGTAPRALLMGGSKFPPFSLSVSTALPPATFPRPSVDNEPNLPSMYWSNRRFVPLGMLLSEESAFSGISNSNKRVQFGNRGV